MIGAIKKYTLLFASLLYGVIAYVYALPVLIQGNDVLIGSTDAWQVIAQDMQVANMLMIDGHFSVLSFFHYIAAHPLALFGLYTWRAGFGILFGEPLGYNIVWILSFVSAGGAAYILLHYFVKHRLAAVIGGFVYAFIPLHAAYSMGFGGATHTEFIPLFVYCFFRFFERMRLRYAIGSVIFFLCISVNEPHYAVSIVFFVVISLIYFFLKRRSLFRTKKFYIYGILAGALGSAALILYYVSLIKIAFSHENYLRVGIEQAINYSNDLIALVIPAVMHPLWGTFFWRNAGQFFTGNPAEHATYLGVVASILAFLALKNVHHRHIVRFWFYVFIIFTLLSLGPVLHIFGIVRPLIPLPYALAYHYLPFLDNMRSVARLMIVAMLAWSVLVAFGVAWIAERFQGKQYLKRLIIFGITAGLMVDFWFVPSFQHLTVPSWYTALNKDPEPFSLIEIPLASNYAFASQASYYNVFHSKEVLGGFDFARKNPDHFIFEKTTPVISELFYALPAGRQAPYDIITHDYSAIGTAIMAKNNIRYAVIDKRFIANQLDFISPRSYLSLQKFIEEYLHPTEKLDTEDLLVYALPRQASMDSVYLRLGNGWYDVKNQQTGKANRNAQQSAELTVVNLASVPKDMEVTFTVHTSSNLFRTMHASYGEERSQTFLLNPTENEITIYLQNVAPDESTLTFSFSNDKNAAIVDDKDVQVVFENVQYRTLDHITLPAAYDVLKTAPGPFIQRPSSIEWMGFEEADHFDQYRLHSDNFLSISMGASGKDLYTTLRIPFIKKMLFSSPTEWTLPSWLITAPDIFKPGFYPYMARAALQYFNVRYVFFNPSEVTEEQAQAFRLFMQSIRGAFQESVSPDGMITYTAEWKDAKQPFIILDNGWGGITNIKESHLKRWLLPHSRFIVVQPSEKPASLDTTFYAFTCQPETERALSVFVDGMLVASQRIKRDHTLVTVPMPNLAKGEHRIELKLADTQGIPVTKEERCTKIYDLSVLPHK